MLILHDPLRGGVVLPSSARLPGRVRARRERGPGILFEAARRSRYRSVLYRRAVCGTPLRTDCLALSRGETSCASELYCPIL